MMFNSPTVQILHENNSSHINAFIISELLTMYAVFFKILSWQRF